MSRGRPMQRIPGPLRRTAAVLVPVLLALAAAAPGARAADPAAEAVLRGDAYVHPSALGAAGADARERLEEVAAELSAPGRPVRIAIVAGPAGAPSMRVYTRRLAERLGPGATLAVTAPGRPVIAVSPLPPAQITRRLRAERVGRIADPVERVTRAAELAVPAPPAAGEGSNLREITGLIGLAVLGGIWAVAWGLRREGRRERERLAEARAAMRVFLDALRARAVALGRRGDLPPPARDAVDRALAAYGEAAASLQQATAVTEVEALVPRLRAALEALSEAGEAAGEPQPADRPFAGLCGVDPAHGPATATAEVAGEEGPVPVCPRCRAAAEGGSALEPRMIPVGGSPVPFGRIAMP